MGVGQVSRLVIQKYQLLEERPLELHRFMVFVGRNDSGKTTALRALAAVLQPGRRLGTRPGRWQPTEECYKEYDVLKELGFDLDTTMHDKTRRATDQVLEESYAVLSKRLEELMAACGDVRAKMEKAQTIRDVRSPKGQEAEGHPFMRPVVQVGVARALRHIVLEQKQLSWDEALKRLSALDWRLASPPWSAVFVAEANKPGAGKMATGKEFTTLLYDLLLVHLAPRSKAQIQRALKEYRTLKGKKYPVGEEELAGRIIAEPAAAHA